MTTLLSRLQSGTRVFDRRLGQERTVYAVEAYDRVVFLSFKNPSTGVIDRQPYPLSELDARFELLTNGSAAFRARPDIVSLVAEAHRLEHAYLFNPLFATETSLIDLVPHQLAAVYGVPPSDDDPQGMPGLLDQPRLRFLLADDAGAGKTIMAGLYIREMLLRGLLHRVLVVPPAGLVDNWERELWNLFRLRFRPIWSPSVRDGYNPFADDLYALAVVSVDTLWRDRVRAAYLAATPYDLVIFDEAHKLAAWRNTDLTVEMSRRYEVADLIARQGQHLLLMTATPHMGKDDPYYLLWRLLEPDLLSTPEAFARLGGGQKRNHLLRRMKEGMIRFDGSPIYPPRESNTIDYPLIQGAGQEQDLYDQTTTYCETHYDRAKQRNRAAAKLAMSILQRRLASSTLALLRSLQRRLEKLEEQIQAVEFGLMTQDELEARQARLPESDVREEKTGDEEEPVEGREEAEGQDDDLMGATDARTLQELQAERVEVARLLRLAQQVYDNKHESKFERLWEALEAYPDTKVLIFTEFRDTLDFLVGRLEGRGLAGRIAQIHGGMDYGERTRQREWFRQPDGARIMVATDAAGEGINLQFCWLLVNYDIPWNPARIEQRMGRVHRYNQKHDVLLVNLVARGTREGRVLKVLLDKLESIRRELGNDKVFDIIGQQFSGKPLKDLIFEAVVEGRDVQVAGQLEDTLSAEKVRERLAAQERKVEASGVRALLKALRDRRDLAEMRRMMPAYVRRFFQQAAPLIGVGVRGDVEAIFALDPCPASVGQAIARYAEGIRQRLTFSRELAMPEPGREPEAIYLHPGEPVFESVLDLFLGQYEQEGVRGAAFLDPDATEPYLFYLARAQVLRDTPDGGSEPQTVKEDMTGVRRYGDGRCERAPAHTLLTLQPAAEADLAAIDVPALLEAQCDTGSVEAYLVQTLAQPALEARRAQEEAQLPQRVAQLRAAHNLRAAELMKQRRILKEAAGKGVPAVQSKLRQCEADLKTLDEGRRRVETSLYAAVEGLRLGPANLYIQALVLPVKKEEVQRRRDAMAEQVALEEVIRRERAEGSVIEDVSAPHLKTGFDLKVMRADGTMRYIEVKGRTGTTGIELTENEWAQAANHRGRYWLYVVYQCDTVPELYRVCDPFGQLLGRSLGTVSITAGQIKSAAQP